MWSRSASKRPFKSYFYALQSWILLCNGKVMAEAGFIADKRCDEVLDILESKRLPDGGHSVPEEECQALVEWMQEH